MARNKTFKFHIIDAFTKVATVSTRAPDEIFQYEYDNKNIRRVRVCKMLE